MLYYCVIIYQGVGFMQDKKYIDMLDSVVLSKNAVEDFYALYNGNAEFRIWLDKFIPEVRKCEEQKQNNPWHKYNVLGHILHSVEEMNAMTDALPDEDKRLLAYTMFFHDIGKPDTHIVREKDGEMIDSFFDHNKRGCEIIEPILPGLGFSAEDSAIISKLVDKHDIFMFITEHKTRNPYKRMLTQSVVREEMADLDTVGDGNKLLKYLIMVGRSDNLAQNEKLTGPSLRMLDRFDEMLIDINEKGL